MNIYQIDEAMMGSDWTDGITGLVKFAEILQKIVGDAIEIEVITDSMNGANNDPIAQEMVSEYAWMIALNQYSRNLK